MTSTAKRITATACMALFLTASGGGVASAVPVWKCEGGQAENFTLLPSGECVSDGKAEKEDDDRKGNR